MAAPRKLNQLYHDHLAMCSVFKTLLNNFCIYNYIFRKTEDNRTSNNNRPANPSTKTDLLDCVQALTIERLATLLLYCVVVTSQRYHLFVWTVFSPKLLYEGMLTVTMSVFSVIVLTLV